MIRVIGAPVDSSGLSGPGPLASGCASAPRVLRECGLITSLDAVDAGDLLISITSSERDPATGVIGWSDVAGANYVTRDAVVSALHAGDLPVVIGGCCSVLPGALAGARDALGVVGLAYIDGHLDTYDGRTSPTGEAAEMPVAIVLGHGPESWVDLIGAPLVAPDAIALLGPRDRAAARRDGAVMPEDLGASSELTPDDLRDLGMERAGHDTEIQLTTSAENFWVHLDVDVLASESMPATDYLQDGGLDWDELTDLMRPLVASAACVGISIGCYNPDKDDAELSQARRLVGLLNSLLRE